jgi:hypothetical protein
MSAKNFILSGAVEITFNACMAGIVYLAHNHSSLSHFIEYMWWMMFLLPGYLVFEYLETQDIAKKSQEDRINFEKSLNFFPVAKINKDVYKEQQF